MWDHIVAYFESMSAGAALSQVNALSDPMVSIRNNNFILQQDARLAWFWAGGANLTRARLVTPSFRQVTNSEIRPYDTAANPSDDPNVAFFDEAAPMLRAQEEIEFQTTNTLGTGSEDHYGIMALNFGNAVSRPAGQSWILRGTSTTNTTADTWSILTVTWDDDLPGGNWIVTGLEHQSSDAIAARLIFDGQFFRPGVLGITALGNRTHPLFSKTPMVMGRFTAFRFPEVEVLTEAADNAHEIYMRVQRAA